MAREETTVRVAERELTLSNLDKVLFPATGFTKADLIDYYAKVAPAMLAHVADRPLTMKRYPNGVDHPFFYEKHAPTHAPGWVRTVSVPSSEGPVDYVVVDDLPTVIWAANLASLEFHVPLWRIGRRRTLPGPPDQIVFDLDPGPGAALPQCARVALLIAQSAPARTLSLRVKTSGSKGMQVYATLGGRPTWERTRARALEIAQHLESAHPALVTSNMRKSLRPGRVLIDWSQNHPAKTTVAAYSVRARPSPTVSTPLTWEEVERCAESTDPAPFEFTTAEVLERVATLGDLFAP